MDTKSNSERLWTTKQVADLLVVEIHEAKERLALLQEYLRGVRRGPPSRCCDAPVKVSGRHLTCSECGTAIDDRVEAEVLS